MECLLVVILRQTRAYPLTPLLAALPQADDPSALQSWAVSTLAPALAELHSALGLQKRQLADLLRVVADAPRAAGAARGDSWPKPRLAFPESERAVAQFQAGTSAWLLSTAPDYLPGGQCGQTAAGSL